MSELPKCPRCISKIEDQNSKKHENTHNVEFEYPTPMCNSNKVLTKDMLESLHKNRK